MNWLSTVILIYILISALLGFHRGFFRVIYSMTALLAAVAFVAFFTPILGQALQEYTPLYDYIETGCEKYVQTQLEENLQDLNPGEMIQIPGMVLPKSLQGQLMQSVREGMYQAMQSQNIYQQLGEMLATLILYLIAFVISSLLILCVLFMLERKLKLFAKKDGIRTINKIAGLFAGLVQAFLVIWVFFLLLRLTHILPVSAALIEQIESNAILRDLYENNRLYELLQQLEKP